jgi:hypothetical protein
MTDKPKRREPAFDDSAEKIEQQVQRNLLRPPPTNKELKAAIKSKTPVTDLMNRLRGR